MPNARTNQEHIIDPDPSLTTYGSSQGAACELRAASLPGRATTRPGTASATSTATTPLTASPAIFPAECVGGSLCPVLQRPLVGLDQSTRLVRKCEGQTLESAQLDTLAEDDSLSDLVQGSRKLLVADHLADDR